jgi:hypothetical protein
MAYVVPGNGGHLGFIAAVLVVADSLNESFAYPKVISLFQDASFEPSTIDIGSGVRLVEMR